MSIPSLAATFRQNKTAYLIPLNDGSCRFFTGIAKASCPSVRPSVTLRYRGHIGWNSAKIISRLISLNFHSLQTNMTDLLQREHPQILAGIGVG